VSHGAIQPNPKQLNDLIKTLKVLIVDDEYYTRKVIRTLLMAVGVTNIHDAFDGPSGLRAICALVPDIVILDWEMPGMDGGSFVRQVRSPSSFQYPNVPIIMLTGHGERSRVIEAVKLGVHEFLLKPVSSSALLSRIASVITKPRTMVRRGEFYGPEPRKMSSYKPELDSFQPHSASDSVTPLTTAQIVTPGRALPGAPPRPAPTTNKPRTAGAVDQSPSYVLFVN
jgi:two-component system, chemotaxis family, chemotaxis protein CheY